MLIDFFGRNGRLGYFGPYFQQNDGGGGGGTGAGAGAGAGGEGGGSGGGTGGGGSTGARRSRLPSAARAGYANLVRRHDDDFEAVAETLYLENFDIRADRRAQDETIAQYANIQTALTAGAQLLQGDALAAYNRYLQLGTPDQLTTVVTEHGQFRERLANHDKDATIREVAEVSKLNYKVLARQGVGRDLEYTFREVDDTTAPGGKRKEAVVVVTTNGVKTEKEVREFASAEWPELWVALDSVDTSSSNGANGQTGRTGLPRQGSGQGSTGAGTFAERHIQSVYPLPGQASGAGGGGSGS